MFSDVFVLITTQQANDLFQSLILNNPYASEYITGRNNSKISGSQLDYLVGESGSPEIYVVVIWPRVKQNNMTNKTLTNIPNIFGCPSDYCCHHLW